MSESMLFPHFLDAGSKGAAVDALHLILCSLGLGDDLMRDGEYGPATVAAVKKLQEVLGFEGASVDGNFGPGTRAALKDTFEINVDAIPLPVGPIETRETHWVGPDTGMQIWPETTA